MTEQRTPDEMAMKYDPKNDCYCQHGAGQVHLRSPSMCTPVVDQENELICEKLLGWEKVHVNDSALIDSGLFFSGWLTPHDQNRATPSFATWAEAGLILDAIFGDGGDVTFATGVGDWWCEINEGPQASDKTGPLSIRAAALEYIRRLP